jgi:hypothetical protein
VIEGDFQAPNWLDLQRLHHNPLPNGRGWPLSTLVHSQLLLRSPKDAAGCEQPQALDSVSMDCVEELAKSPVAKISISRAEPDLRGPVGAPSGNDRCLRAP